MAKVLIGISFLAAVAIAYQSPPCGVYRQTVLDLCGELGQGHPHCTTNIAFAKEAGCMNTTILTTNAGHGRKLLGASHKSDAECSPEGNLNCAANGGVDSSGCPDTLSQLKFWGPWGSWSKKGFCTSFSHGMALSGVTASCQSCLGYDWVLTKGLTWHPQKADKKVGAIGVKRVVCSSDSSCKVFKRAVCIRCPSNQFSSTNPGDIDPSTYKTERQNFIANCAVNAMSNYNSYKCNDNDKIWFANDVATL